MNTPNTSLLDDRTIWEGLHAEAEASQETLDTNDEDRPHPRYPRRLPGKLIIDGVAHPITCLTISHGALRVITPNTMKIPVGTRVKARLRIGGRVIEDDYTIIHGSQGSNGVTFHLGL